MGQRSDLLIFTEWMMVARRTEQLLCCHFQIFPLSSRLCPLHLCLNYRTVLYLLSKNTDHFCLVSPVSKALQVNEPSLQFKRRLSPENSTKGKSGS